LEKAASLFSARPDIHGLFRSKTFPRLVLDIKALLAMNAPKVLSVLQRGLVSAVLKSFSASLR